MQLPIREICYCASKSYNIIDIQFVTKGLHDVGETRMRAELQPMINDADITKYDAILLGYGLCNNGIRGLRARLPMWYRGLMIALHFCSVPKKEFTNISIRIPVLFSSRRAGLSGILI